MKQPKTFDDDLNRLRNLSKQLFGEITEISEEEAEELLNLAGIDSVILKERMYQLLSSQAREARMKGKALSAFLEEALEDLRPESAPARTEEELKTQATSKLSALLTSLQRAFAPAQLRFAYRKKKELSQSDRQFLDKIAKTVEERAKGTERKQ